MFILLKKSEKGVATITFMTWINQITVIFSLAGTFMLLHVTPGLQSHHNEVGIYTTRMHSEYIGNLIFIIFFSILLLLRCDITDDNLYYVNRELL